MIKKVAVLGAGTMGHAIAGEFAANGIQVNIYESFDAVRNSAVDRIKAGWSAMVEQGVFSQEHADKSVDNIALFADMKEAVCDVDMVVEAVPENLELKHTIFADLDKFCKPGAILATNTSSLTLESIISVVSDERKPYCLVCHYFNPANIIPLVEVSCFGATSSEVADQVTEMYLSMGKHPVRVRKDVTGMVVNRLTHSLLRESVYMMDEGIASAEDVDTALKYGIAFRAAVIGVLGAVDMGGMDVYAITSPITWPDLSKADKPGPSMADRVAAGKYGLKTGEGFFSYKDKPASEVLYNFNKNLLTQLKATKTY